MLMRTFKWIGHQIAVAIMGFKEGYATGKLDAEGQQVKRAMEERQKENSRTTPHPSGA
tara:strand:- start:1317 stop:1490 length:174 start_codon:yes stop_codon:yes gene_type:complete